MIEGLLWYDNANRPLAEKVQRAAAYYAEKYRQEPNVCCVHPSTLEGQEMCVDGVELREDPRVLPNHFWIGYEEPKKRG